MPKPNLGQNLGKARAFPLISSFLAWKSAVLGQLDSRFERSRQKTLPGALYLLNLQ